jgi:uncharacterized protein
MSYSTVTPGNTTRASAASSSGYRGLIRRRPMTAYLVLAFTGLWLSLLPVILFDAPYRLFSAIGAILGLGLPAFLVTAVTDGRAGVRELLGRTVRWRVDVRWYALAVLGTPATMFLIGTAVAGTAPLDALTARWSLLVTVFVPQLLVAIFTTQIFEELGWTGLVQHKLQDRHGALRAALLVVAPFTLIHFPTYLIGAPVTGAAVVRALTMLIPVAIFGIFFRVLIAWLYNGSGRSVFVAALVHAVFNTAGDSKFAPQFFPPTAAMWLPLAAVVVLGLLAAVLTKGRLAYQPGPGGARQNLED